MATTNTNIPPFTCVANVQKNSAAITPPSRVTAAQITLADPNGVWATTPGNIKIWGMMQSTDGGTTWNWGPSFQGDATDSTKWIPFGTVARDGTLPSVRASRTRSAGNVVGVSNTTNPTITTDVANGLAAGNPVNIQNVLGATGVNGNFTVLAVVSPTQFTITAAAPGVYQSGGMVQTPDSMVPAGTQVRASILADSGITLGATIAVTD